MNEFEDIVQRLRDERPEVSELELDRIKQRVRRQAARPSRRRQEAMKSRLAILAMLVFGMLLSTTGAGLAIDSLTSKDASVAQYGPPAGEEEDPGGGVLGEEEEGTRGGGGGGGGGESPEVVQPTRQVEASTSGDELPFTGLLAIPVLIGGVALLSTGLVLRHRTRDDGV